MLKMSTFCEEPECLEAIVPAPVSRYIDNLDPSSHVDVNFIRHQSRPEWVLLAVRVPPALVDRQVNLVHTSLHLLRPTMRVTK